MNLIDLTELGKADLPGWKECDVRVEKTED